MSVLLNAAPLIERSTTLRLPEKQSTQDVSIKKSLCERVSSCYQKIISSIVNFCRDKGYYMFASVLGTCLTEPFSVLKAAFLFPLNIKNNFNFSGLNPTTLTEDQSKKEPVLLIHGNFFNQTAWLSLSHKLKAHYEGPVYTINLPSGKVTKKDFKIISKKIDQIMKHYKTPKKVNLIGHSRGAAIAYQVAKGNRSDQIGKVISIGTPVTKSEASSLPFDLYGRYYEVIGENDLLVPSSSSLSARRHQNVSTGHLGLLFSSETHTQIIDWLNA